MTQDNDRGDRPEDRIEGLVTEFEAGKITRRALIRGLAAMGVASLAVEGLAAALGRTKVAASHINDVTGDQISDPGRKVLLERIMNHKYDYKPGTINRATLVSSSFDIFSSTHEHQAWLFGETYPDGGGSEAYYEHSGLRNYRSGNVGNRTATTRASKNANASGINDGADFGNGNHSHRRARSSLQTAVAQADTKQTPAVADKGMDVFQLGHATEGPDYDFQDLYGLVKLKLTYIHDHCIHNATQQTAMFFKKELHRISTQEADPEQRKRAGIALEAMQDIVRSAAWDDDLKKHLEGSEHGDEHRPIDSAAWNEIRDALLDPKILDYPGTFTTGHDTY